MADVAERAAVRPRWSAHKMRPSKKREEKTASVAILHCSNVQSFHVKSNKQMAYAERAVNLASDETSDLHGLRVLVVDDEDDARDIVAAMLKHEGADVETAPSAREGFELVPQFRPHVLVSDIGMPGEDGYSFVARVRQLPPQTGGRTPAIALTAYTSPEDQRRALAAGFNVHLGKPIDLRHLISVIFALSQSSTAAHP